MQPIQLILKEIKDKKLNVSEVARTAGIPVQRFHKWMQGEGKPKADDAEKLKKWAINNLEEVTSQIVMEPPTAYKSFENETMKSLLNLTESNRVLAESNKTLAETNSKLADNNVVLTSAFGRLTAGSHPGTTEDVIATVRALQEYTTELAAEVRKTSVSKSQAELGTKMVAKKKQAGRKGTKAGAGR